MGRLQRHHRRLALGQIVVPLGGRAGVGEHGVVGGVEAIFVFLGDVSVVPDLLAALIDLDVRRQPIDDVGVHQADIGFVVGVLGIVDLGFLDVVRADQTRERIAHGLVAVRLAVVGIVATDVIFDRLVEDEGA